MSSRAGSRTTTASRASKNRRVSVPKTRLTRSGCRGHSVDSARSLRANCHRPFATGCHVEEIVAGLQSVRVCVTFYGLTRLHHLHAYQFAHGRVLGRLQRASLETPRRHASSRRRFPIDHVVPIREIEGVCFADSCAADGDRLNGARRRQCCWRWPGWHRGWSDRVFRQRGNRACHTRLYGAVQIRRGLYWHGSRCGWVGCSRSRTSQQCEHQKSGNCEYSAHGAYCVAPRLSHGCAVGLRIG